MKTQFSILLVVASAASSALAGLTAYDVKIASDDGAGLPHVAISTTTLNFDGTNAESFNFGAVTGSSTIEFILSGDPVGGGRDGFLAVGANSTWNLRYEQWDDTGQLGFTHLGVIDYTFTQTDVLSLDSPTELTHVTYRWDQDTTTMDLYLDGVLAGTNSAATAYQMPTGNGFLGNNAGQSEGMLGVIERVTVYNDAIDPETILAHANAWLGIQLEALKLTVHSDGPNLVFTWPSQVGKNYDLLSETGLETDPTTWAVFGGHQGIVASPPENILTIPRPTDPERFFVVTEKNAPPFFFDDFESGQGDWTTGINDANGNTAWQLGTPNGTTGPSTGADSSANAFSTNLGDFAPDADIFLRSPALDLTDNTIAGATLTCDQYRDGDGFGDLGTIRILKSSDFTELGTLNPDLLNIDVDWVQFSADLPAAALGESIIIEFSFTSDGSNDAFSGWSLDNVEVKIN